MTLETFHPRKLRDRRPEFFDRARRGLDHTGARDEVVRAQRRGKARRTACGQHVIGTGEVVAERRGAKLAHEYRAGRAYPPNPSRRVPEIEFEMLGRDPVGERERLLE